jgi:hypothetical protein
MSMMKIDQTTVTVVLDPEYGAKVLNLSVPIWIVDSFINRPFVEEVWKQAQSPSHVEGITLFKDFGINSREALLIKNLETIDHASWRLFFQSTIFKTKCKRCGIIRVR